MSSLGPSREEHKSHRARRAGWRIRCWALTGITRMPPQREALNPGRAAPPQGMGEGAAGPELGLALLKVTYLPPEHL